MTPAHPALRYHGGKFRLAPWVIKHFPAHVTYVEPFGGAAGVLLHKPRTYAEVYNDLDGEIVNFFRVLRDPAMCARLIDLCHLTPFARAEFELAYEPTDDMIEQARRTAVRAGMGFGSGSATKGTSGFRNDTARHYGTAQHIWQKYPASLAAIGERFAGVLIENRPAVDVMQAHDRVDTLHYADPPYVHGTRVTGASKGRYYRHEMTDADHEALLAALKGLQGLVVVSGYPTALYNDTLAGWHTVQTKARISANRGTDTRTEQLWLNPLCVENLKTTGQQMEMEIAA